jgi:hypothetical protein
MTRTREQNCCNTSEKTVVTEVGAGTSCISSDFVHGYEITFKKTSVYY